jgi:hypothetical protein
LIIVDAKGKDRIILGAPVPDPGGGGKRVSPANGISFNGADGIERGGVGMLDNGNLVFCLDGQGGEAACMYVLPSGESAVRLSDPKSGQSVELSAGSQDGNGLLLRDKEGKARARLRLSSSGEPSFELLDAKGNVLHKSP